MKRIQALFMTGSIPLLYLHYPNDLMGTRPWQTGKSAARCWQAAPARQTRAPVAREERYSFILILNHHLHKHIVTEIVLLLLVAPSTLLLVRGFALTHDRPKVSPDEMAAIL